MLISTRARRTVGALIAGVALALVPAVPALAHVTVSSADASPGGFGKLVFRVPNESDTANTTMLTVTLPADTPFPFVSVGAVPGWTSEAVTSPLPEPVEVEGFTVTEAVTSVTWTADGDGLPPGQFTEFALSVGPIPDVEQLAFPSTQTYSDGEVVDWAEPVVEGEDEPAHPAPVLDLAAPADSGGSSDSGDSSDTLARTLAIIGVVLGAAGLVVALSGRRARPRAAASGDATP
jgi:uncharacterized protein